MMKKLLLPLLASAVVSLPLPACAADRAPVHPGREASIPFVSMGSIRDWRAIDSDTLLIQATGGRWYRAELMTSCTGLPYANTIGFDARGTNRLDRFASVIVRGQHCPITSLTESAPPPRKAHRRG